MQPNMPHLWSLGLYCNLTNSDFLKYQEASNLSCTRFLEPQAGSQNMFSGPPRTPATFPGQFPGLNLLEILIFNPRLVQCYEGKISILPSKEVKEMNQYAQETCQEVQESCSGIQETYY